MTARRPPARSREDAESPHGGTSARAPDRWPLALAAIATGAFLLRLWNILALRDTPLATVLVGDGREYDAWAARLAAGDWLGTEVFYQSPLYPYLLGALYALLGDDPQTARLVQAVFGAMSCVLIGLAGRSWLGRREGLIAAGLLACYPPAIFYDGLIQKSSLDLLLVTGALAALGLLQAARHLRWIVITAICAGLLAVNRENAIVLVPVLAVWLAIGSRGSQWRTSLAHAAVFVLVVAAMFAPIAWRNSHVSGRFTISTFQAGANFYIGNRAGASGTYEPLAAGRGDARYERSDAVRLAEADAGRSLTPGEVSTYWWQRATTDIRSDPAAWLALLGRKALLAIGAREAIDTESIEAYAEFSPVLRALGWLTFGLLLPLAVLGVWIRRGDWRRLAVVYAAAAALTASAIAFYVLARYRFPVVPIALLFASVPVAVVTSRGWAGQRWWPGLAAAIVAGILAHLPLERSADMTWYSVGAELHGQERSAEAVPLLRRAVTEAPDHADAHAMLAEALDRTGDAAGALGHFEIAVRLRPDQAADLIALSHAMVKAGRTTTAVVRARDAVRVAPDAADAHAALGSALWWNGQSAEAGDAYRKAVALGSRDAAVYNNLATALQAEGRHADAVPLYEVAVQLRSDYVEARSNLAMAYAATGRSAEAEAQFRESLKLSAGHYAIHANYGDLLKELGRNDDALEQYRLAVAGAPGSVDVDLELLERLADAYRLARRHADTVDVLTRARNLADRAGRYDRAAAYERQIAAARQRAGGRRP